MKYLLYIFDLDGTLINSSKSISMALWDTVRELGGQMRSLKNSEKLYGQSLKVILETLGIADIEQGIAVYRKHYYRHIDSEKPYPGIVAMLKKLYHSVLMAIATNKGEEGTRTVLSTYRIDSYFDILSCVENGQPKPHRDQFDRIIEFYKRQGKHLEPGDCLMVGDSPTDMEFAVNSGIDSAFVTWGFFKLEELSYKPTHIISRPQQLIELNQEEIELEIGAELDLHTFAPRDIKLAVKSYLSEVVRKRLTTVRLIHGKGTGVQRRIVREILTDHPYVKRFYNAPYYLGGLGATMVELRLPNDQ